MDVDQYRVFLPGTHFFDANANREALDPVNARSLVAVAPVIVEFLSANKLLEGKPDAARGVDRSLLDEALKP
jgi:NitT/TauT family transport system substrate-binding protein